VTAAAAGYPGLQPCAEAECGWRAHHPEGLASTLMALLSLLCQFSLSL